MQEHQQQQQQMLHWQYNKNQLHIRIAYKT